MIVTAGKTSVSIFVYFIDDVSGTNTGEPTTGLLFSDIETGGSASYARQGAARVDFTLITLASASAAYAEGGFILIDDTNMKGLYRLDVPNAAFATGVDQVVFQLEADSGKNTVMRPIIVDITDFDLRVATPAVNVTQLAGVVQSLTDLKDFADAGYDPAVNKVEGVKLADTLTTYTSDTPQTGDNFARIGANGASLTDLGGMATGMKAEVKTEVDNALGVDTIAEEAQGIPPATPTLKEAMSWWWMQWRNDSTVTSSERRVVNDAGVVQAKAPLSDDGSEFSPGEMISGP